MDHCFKFNSAFLLQQKSVGGVANTLQKWVFHIMRLPSILHCDNGREFINHIIEEVWDKWPRQVQLVGGRPRHPQSWGLVERAHFTMQRMIGGAKNVETQCKHPPWADPSHCL